FFAKFGAGALEICWKKMAQTLLSSLLCATIGNVINNSAKRSKHHEYERRASVYELHMARNKIDAKSQKTAKDITQRKNHDDNQPKCKYHTNCHGIHPYGIYQDAPYHHQNSSGIKSPAPIDGQTALDRSIPISINDKNKKRRIGLSYSQLVILDQTTS